MPIIALSTSNPLSDGRQSDRALDIRCGVERRFEEMGHATLPELCLRDGRRADVVAICPKGRITIVEIKSSVADFQADTKWTDYLNHCDRFYFATLADVPAHIFPEDRGFLVADRYGCEVVRETDAEPVSAARRKDVHLRFARQAAQRLRRAEQYGLETGS